MIKWIAWERHRRTIELSSFLGIEPIILESKAPRILKHPWFIFLTIRQLAVSRIDTLIVQNPSIVLTLIACLLHRFLCYKLIVDTHNVGIQPEQPLLRKFNFLYTFFQREADLTVVTNAGLASIVKSNGGQPFILPDIIPRPKSLKKVNLKGKYNLVYICTYGNDEPYMEVISAATKLPTDYVLYVTGNYKKVQSMIDGCPSDNVIFTGFVDEDYYWNLLYSCDLVIDLTLRDDCLVCGAYEAVSVGTPMILSGTMAIKRYFSKGCVYSENMSASLVNSIHDGIRDIEKLRFEVVQLKNELLAEWENTGIKLENAIYGDVTN